MLFCIYLSYTHKTKTATDRTGQPRTMTRAANPQDLGHWKQQMLCAHTWAAKNNVSNTWVVKGTLRCGASDTTQCDYTSSGLQNSDTNSKCQCAWPQTTTTSVRADYVNHTKQELQHMYVWVPHVRKSTTHRDRNTCTTMHTQKQNDQEHPT